MGFENELCNKQPMTAATKTGGVTDHQCGWEFRCRNCWTIGIAVDIRFLKLRQERICAFKPRIGREEGTNYPPDPDRKPPETVYFVKNRPARNAQQLGQVSLVELLVILILYPQLLREE
ncbi:MAG: hypothetical protein V4719_29935 [Planctomycetota bacterium]